MRQLLIVLYLFTLSFSTMAEHGEFMVKAVELIDDGNNEYTFKFIQLSEPFGYKHRQDREVVVHLRFECPIYECLEEDGLPTESDYNAAIELLKQNISGLNQFTIELADRGYAEIKGKENEFQSNALYIHEGIICTDYDFFDF